MIVRLSVNSGGDYTHSLNFLDAATALQHFNKNAALFDTFWNKTLTMKKLKPNQFLLVHL
jgi:hypothetical protein